jgi:hypothetical protein
VLDPVGVQVLQLNVIVVQQPSEESVRGHRQAALVQGDKGNDIPILRHRLILVVRYKLLICSGPRTKEALPDKALHLRMSDIRMRPRLYHLTTRAEG